MKIIQYGLGPVGASIARLAWDRGMKLVGGLDIDLRKVGRDMGEFIGIAEKTGIRVVDSFAKLEGNHADVVLHATTSRLDQVAAQIMEVTEAGLPVITTCEELAYPYFEHQKEATALDASARAHHVAVLATGVNPGFAMDVLPLTLAGACQRVDRMLVTRIVDAATRREPLQRKIGAGLTPAEFEKRVSQGLLGHVGLRESAAMILDALGWKVDSLQETLEPVVATTLLRTKYVEVARGRVAGINQRLTCMKGATRVLQLVLKMYVGAKAPVDVVKIEGVPNLTQRIEGGIPGDEATAALVVNSIPRVLASPPGLKTVIDLPVAVPGR